jgi:hypothetical protein
MGIREGEGAGVEEDGFSNRIAMLEIKFHGSAPFNQKAKFK